MSSMEKEQILKINKRSFITVCVILVSFMVLAYALTFFLGKGEYITVGRESGLP